MEKLPNEINQKILYYYIPLYMACMKKVHHELTCYEPTLHLTEHLFDFELDFHYRHLQQAFLEYPLGGN